MDIRLTVRNKEGPDASVQTAAITFNLNKTRGNNIPEILLVYDINLFNLITSKIHKSQTLDRAQIEVFFLNILLKSKLFSLTLREIKTKY